MTDSVIFVLGFGLSAAISWGVGDFYGGYSTKFVDGTIVLLISQIIGLTFILPLIFLYDQAFKSETIVNVFFAGLFGAVGLFSLYEALARGTMALIAPVAAVISSTIPIVFASLTEGFPILNQLIGIFLGFVAIILLSWSQSDPKTGEVVSTRVDLLLAGSAGLGFGGLFIYLSFLPTNSIFVSLALLRIVIIALVFILFSTKFLFSRSNGNKDRINHKLFLTIALAGIGDSLGNIFFVFAADSGRLDIAAITSSLYPLSTIFLAWIYYREKVKKHQWLGILLALFAVVLFSL